MASKQIIIKRLKEFGFTFEDFSQARTRWEKKDFTFSYGGGGKYRGMFHVTTLQKTTIGCQHLSYIAFSPERMIDEIITLKREIILKLNA